MRLADPRSHQTLLQSAFGDRYQFDQGQHHVAAWPREVLRTLGVLKRDLGYTLLSSVAEISTAGHEVYREHSSLQRDLTLHILNLEQHQRTQVHVLLAPGEALPSLEHLYPGFERKYQSAIGNPATTEPVPLELPPVRANPNLSEPPYPEELRQWYLFDLAHPLTRHRWELAVEAHDGRVQRSLFQSGFWHRGIERRARQLPLLSLAPLLDVAMPAAAPLVGVAWVKTIEDFFSWQIPERAQAMRMIFVELSRVNAHLESLGRIAEELALDEGTHLCREACERIKQSFEFYAGARVLARAVVLGGMPHDFPAGWVQEAFSLFRVLDHILTQYRRLLTQHPLARRRLQMAGLSGQSALELGLTGPALRAAGVNFDLRKARPFYFYRDVDFDVPVGLRGEAHDRLLILLEETHQSLRILWQVLDNLPLGPVVLEHAAVESLRRFALTDQDWKELVRRAQRPWCSQYTAIESPYGEFGFHLVLTPDAQTPWSLRVKTHADAQATALHEILRGCPVQDLSLALSSLDLYPGALDL